MYLATLIHRYFESKLIYMRNYFTYLCRCSLTLAIFVYFLSFGVSRIKVPQGQLFSMCSITQGIPSSCTTYKRAYTEYTNSPSRFDTAMWLALVNRMCFFSVEALKSNTWLIIFCSSCYNNLENMSRWSSCQPGSLSDQSDPNFSADLYEKCVTAQLCHLFLQYNSPS